MHNPLPHVPPRPLPNSQYHGRFAVLVRCPFPLLAPAEVQRSLLPGKPPPPHLLLLWKNKKRRSSVPKLRSRAMCCPFLTPSQTLSTRVELSCSFGAVGSILSLFLFLSPTIVSIQRIGGRMEFDFCKVHKRRSEAGVPHAWGDPGSARSTRRGRRGETHHQSPP